jgi:deoxycytidine triphosphate deaminase
VADPQVAAPPPGALGRATLERFLDASPPLVEGLRDRAAQLQPHGIDLTLESLWRFTDAGSIGGPSPGRRLPERQLVEPGADGWYTLEPGPYVAVIHERLHIPTTVMALAWPRSTFLRCGAMLGTAVVDAGYEGRPEALLVVANLHGISLAVDVALCQLVCFTLTERVPGYDGAYQGR